MTRLLTTMMNSLIVRNNNDTCDKFLPSFKLRLDYICRLIIKISTNVVMDANQRHIFGQY